jgi:hypothetical protein
MVRSCVWAALTPFLIVACDDPAICLPEAFAAVTVHALSAADSTPVLNARGEVRDGSFADSLVDAGQGYYDSSEDRPGTYAVHLEHPSYTPWDTSGVVVLSSGSGCPVLGTQVEARLAPIEPLTPDAPVVRP